MFPRSGLFADINGPFSKQGSSTRPQDLYEHDSTAGIPSTSSSFSANLGTAGIDEGIPELQRINEEIETVKHEVELEQRRLFQYQTSLGEGSNTPPSFPVYKVEGTRKKEGRAIDAMAANSPENKYLVDNSKPKTCLEYGPMSDFSAGLWFCGLSNEQRVLDRNEPSPCDQNMFPVLLDESTEDCPLSIDCPLSPARKRTKYEKRDDYSADNPQDEKQLKESKPTLATACPQQALEEMHCDKYECEQREGNPDYGGDVNNASKGFENIPIPVDSSVTDLTEGLYLEHQESLSQLLDIDTSSVEIETNDWLSSEIQMQSLLLDNQEMANTNPATMDTAFNNQTSLAMSQQQPHSYNSSHQMSSMHNNLANEAIPPESSHQPSQKDNVIIISSTEDEDLNYSDVDLSESDPMEECYRIFMEANENLKEPEKEIKVPKELTVPSSDLLRKKWVAHEAKDTESKPERQILSSLCEPALGLGSQSSVTSNIHQVQQRAPMLTSTVNGGQAFVSFTSQRNPETQTNAVHTTWAPPITQPVPVLNACTHYPPLENAVIEVGNNFQLIIPEGTFPLPMSSVNSPLTSVGPVPQSNSLGVKQLCFRAAVTPVQRYHTTATMLIPAQSCRPSPCAVEAHLNPTPSTSYQPAVQPVKPVPTKRKLKQCKPARDEVTQDVRQRYVNMFTEEFHKTIPNIYDAFERAMAEERIVYNRSPNKLKYVSVAVNSLKRLKNKTTAPSRGKKATSEIKKGKTSFNFQMCRENKDAALFQGLNNYVLLEEVLIENNYPIQNPEKPGSAVLFEDTNRGNMDPLKRTCCRCGTTYSVSKTGQHVRKEECNYHYGRGVERKVPGGVETRYSCCQGVMGAPGCQVSQLHVHHSFSLDGFVSTRPRHPSDTHCPGVYSLDCAMCYTVSGLELSRVSVANSRLQVIYDTFVRPDNELIDYNTRFSGVSEEDLKGNNTSLREVQETLMSFINADTILIGHGLEKALCALKLLHGRVVDTSLVFPHRLGPPHKHPLNHLTAEFLRKIIQERVCGHDTAEDAAACMELMLWKTKKDGKLKK
ncbi:RNA exonuclease 1 homolog isoform X2 [Cynoglossus semilaevis]|uniref:Exonuclease GOR-like n=1 Tax=Cynoglossus semilaevis TaxID=244447 RepID=A0A3P8WSZ5_CYNSE|nr:RNA exonuclease 1 homolog isoform X2 [Cynoglossus semilaevis]